MIISPLGFAQVKPCYVKCHAVTIQFLKNHDPLGMGGVTVEEGGNF